jgi:hypothetical protein
MVTVVVCSDEPLPHEASDIFYSALATLPALGSIRLFLDPEDESTLAIHVSLTELLRSPSLRSVCFTNFLFTSALCQATAHALIEGTAITNLDFRYCSLPFGECAAMMANAIGRIRQRHSLQSC